MKLKKHSEVRRNKIKQKKKTVWGRNDKTRMLISGDGNVQQFEKRAMNLSIEEAQVIVVKNNFFVNVL